MHFERVFWQMGVKTGRGIREGFVSHVDGGESGGDGEQRESIVKQVSSTGGHKSVNGSER